LRDGLQATLQVGARIVVAVGEAAGGIVESEGLVVGVSGHGRERSTTTSSSPRNASGVALLAAWRPKRLVRAADGGAWRKSSKKRAPHEGAPVSCRLDLAALRGRRRPGRRSGGGFRRRGL